jgi:hypothetical protein
MEIFGAKKNETTRGFIDTEKEFSSGFNTGNRPEWKK